MIKPSTVILEGGLGNRMRVAASAYALARESGLPLRVLWTSQWGMRCRFDELFDEAPTLNSVADGDKSLTNSSTEPFIRDARGMERVLYARPTLKNAHVPKLLQRCWHRDRIYAPQIWHLNQTGYDYEAWFRQGGTLMTAYRDFYAWTPEDLQTLFRPNAEVRRLVEERCEMFAEVAVGVHIRRTDHQQAIDESPLELFTKMLDREVEACQQLTIYLATDDEATKQALRQRYGKRVLMSPVVATRESTDGIREGLVEMLALSRTQRIYGSAGSTFSPIAACLGNVPIQILTCEGSGSVDLMCPLQNF